MEKKCILFDLGGVLINWKNSWLVKEISRRHHLDNRQLNEEFGRNLHLLYCGKIDENKFWSELGKNMNSNFLCNNTNSIFEEVFKKYASINNSLLNLAFKIRESGIKIGLFSNNEPAKFNVVKEWISIKNFDYVFLSYQIGFMKPDKKIYQHVLEKLPFVGNEIIFIDDRKQNVKVAKQMGIDGIEFFEFENLYEELISRNIKV